MNDSSQSKSQRRNPIGLRYFLASVLLIVLLMGFYAFLEARRIGRDLVREMEEKGLALMEALETSGQNAIAASASQEEMLSQRLLDNAHLIDRILGMRGYDEAFIKRIAMENRLQKVEILDTKGEPFVPSPAPPMGWRMMEHGRMMGERPDTERDRPFPFIWGHRWHFQMHKGKEESQALPKPLQERKFWAGSDFGVAIQARSFPGYIVVHADANYILKARRDVGVQRLMEDLGKRPGIVYVSFQDKDFIYLAHSDPQQVGRVEKDPFLLDLLKVKQGKGRTLSSTGKGRIYEVVKPFALSESNTGIFRIGLSVEPMDRVWSQGWRSTVLYTAGLLIIGVLGALAIFLNQGRHLKEVKALEEEVERRERLSSLGSMAAAIAHEIRNPLNAIAVGLQRLAREFHPAPEEGQGEYARFLQILRGEVKRLNEIVEEFLALARPPRLELQECSPSDLLEEVSALMREMAEARAIVFLEDVPQDLPRLTADPRQLKQALINIIQNGLQATPAGGNLTIRAKPVDRSQLTVDRKRLFARQRLAVIRQPTDFIEISITDTGEGIPPENLGHVFDPYFTTREGGTGLGLSIAHRIIEGHGGSIEVESQVGKGTAFKIQLPVVSGQ
ncbi:MAG: hypothetical protein HY998_07975 [candidate division NC10 bacterium]|nr:hypothetical protein [candidate division NC10 bacterium]